MRGMKCVTFLQYVLPLRTSPMAMLFPMALLYHTSAVLDIALMERHREVVKTTEAAGVWSNQHAVRERKTNFS